MRFCPGVLPGLGLVGLVGAGVRTAIAAVSPHSKLGARPLLARHALDDVARKADDAMDPERAHGAGALGLLRCWRWGELGGEMSWEGVCVCVCVVAVVAVVVAMGSGVGGWGG